MYAEFQDTYLYNCYSKERMLGVVSLVIMFLPGFMLAFLICITLRKSSWNMWICVLISLVLCVTFPILLFIVKVCIICSNLLPKKTFWKIVRRDDSYTGSSRMPRVCNLTLFGQIQWILDIVNVNLKKVPYTKFLYYIVILLFLVHQKL